MTLRDLTAGFADDAPKRDPASEDALGYRGFSERLGGALARIDAPEGYVVGLHGPWGAGKSTVLNFVEAFIFERQAQEDPDFVDTAVVRFEPWIVSGYQDLAAAFFKVLSLRLADGVEHRSNARRRLARTARLGIDPVLDAAATLGAVIDHTGGALSRGAAAAAKKGLGGAVDRWLAEPSLQGTYEALAERLAKAARRHLVMIDDIDRLAADEIRSIMRMVKTVGRLPNVVYLLAYDREIVWPALREDGDGTLPPGRPGFGEKIVQHEVELPTPSRRALLAMLDAAIPFLPAPPANSIRWYELAQAGLHRWVRRPRDVARLSNALRFAWAALGDEVDPQDLICMEGLRLFQRPVFDWVRENRDALLRDGVFRFLPRERNEEVFERFAGGVPEAARQDTLRLMGILFPNRTKSFDGGRSLSSEAWHETAARRGIATREAFDAYFSLQPLETAIPKALVDRAMSSLGDEVTQVACIEEAVARQDEFGNTLAGSYFEELRYRFAGRGAEPTQAILNALIRMNDTVVRLAWDGDFLTPIHQLNALILDVLGSYGTVAAGQALKASFDLPVPIATKCDLLLHEARETGLVAGGPGPKEPRLGFEDVKGLAAELLPAIQAGAQDGSLDDAHHYHSILRIWALTGSADDAKAWISRVALSGARRFAALCSSFLGYSRDGAGKTYSLSEAPDPRLYDLGVLRCAAATFADARELDEDERRRVVATRDGLRDVPGVPKGPDLSETDAGDPL